jgi:hypothetical protein
MLKLVQIFSNSTIAPEGFQSIHVYRTAPGPIYSEQVLVNGGAVLLVGGDDKGQDTAIHQELLQKYNMNIDDNNVTKSYASESVTSYPYLFYMQYEV